jgi:hypothetical protein
MYMFDYDRSEFTFLKIAVLWLSETVLQSRVIDKAAFYHHILRHEVAFNQKLRH